MLNACSYSSTRRALSSCPPKKWALMFDNPAPRHDRQPFRQKIGKISGKAATAAWTRASCHTLVQPGLLAASRHMPHAPSKIPATSPAKKLGRQSGLDKLP